MRDSYDVVIRGGGIVGISTAVSIKEREPDATVVVLERSIPPRGATTRNAGFACFGSISEVCSDVDSMGVDAAVALVKKRAEGLAALRKRCGDAAMELDMCGGHEVFVSDHPALQRIEEINTLLSPIFEADVYRRNDEAISRFGFLGVRAMVTTDLEGALHSGKLIERLWTLAQERGVEIVHTTELPKHYGVVVHATNALESSSTLTPSRGQILVTEELPEPTTVHGTFHMDEGYVYFRNVGNRILLGGGRNQAFAEEQTTEFETTAHIQQYLEHILYTMILPGKNPAVEYRWSGIMGFSKNKQPIVGWENPHNIRAFGCNGMGVALGTTIGDEVASLIVAGF